MGGGPCVHCCWMLQVNVPAHAFVVLPHAVPDGAAGFEHVPVDGSQLPGSWQASSAVQTTGFAPVHVPLAQAYDWKHAFVPVQETPSATAGFEHVPEVGSHVPTTWHWSLAVQVTGPDPEQVPLVQA